MRTVESETIITPVSNDNSAGTILGVVLGLIAIAVVCYFLFFRSPRIVEHNTTINQPSPVLPAPAPAPMPAPNVSNTTINVPGPADNAAAPAPVQNQQPASTSTSESTTTTTNP